MNIGKQIGESSANGAVFTLNTKNGTRKVVKIIASPLGKKEFAFQKIAGLYGISPRVYKLKQRIAIPRNVYVNYFPKMKGAVRKFNAFSMNNLKLHKMDTIMSIHDFFKSRALQYKKQKVFNKLKLLVKKLHGLGIEHGDLHGGNAYVITHADGSIDVKIIDFGRSRKRPSANIRSMSTGTFYGKNVTKEYNWSEPIFKRKGNKNPIIPNRIKLQGFKTKFYLS